MTPDLINGLFEFVGGVLLWINVRALHRDKKIAGVRIFPTAFFAAWGFWNLYFYPHLGQWLSFLGGCNIVIANTVWVSQMIWYSSRERAVTLAGAARLPGEPEHHYRQRLRAAQRGSDR